MILVDSSVWIALFRGDNTPHTRLLRDLLEPGDEDKSEIAIADLILQEVLQGVRTEKQAQTIIAAVEGLPCPTLGSKPLVILAAANYRRLRQKGVTVRTTIDCLIATFCIESDVALLHNDRDFEPFEKYLGLRAVKSIP
ncbi:MAG: PIN domain nuclease [Sideroxydans sp.]